MITRHIFLAAFAFAVIAKAADETPVLHEPDHLVPVDPYPRDWQIRYDDQVCTHFRLDRPFYFQMLVRPSFSPEYVVRLRGNEKNPWDISAADKVILSYTIADKNIWYSMPENNDKKQKQNVTVSTSATVFPKTLGVRVHELWKKMLLRTRYPEETTGGLDGTTFEFSMWRVYGEVWSPQERKSPLLFVELGDSLIAYCKAAPTERTAAAKQIEDKASQLEKYLNEHLSK